MLKYESLNTLKEADRGKYMLRINHNRYSDAPNFLFNTDVAYSKRIIIDFTSDPNTVIALKAKLDKRHPASQTITIEDYDALCAAQREGDTYKADSAIGIYVIGHCEPGSDVLVCGKEGNPEHDQQIHFTELAPLLLNLIGNDQAVINLIACGAARGKKNNINSDNGRLSFAAKLHACMFDASEKDIPVIARMHYSMTMVMTGKSTFTRESILTCKFRTMDLSVDWNEGKDAGPYLSKQYGSKIIYCKGENNYQIKFDAYSQSWKREVINTLVKLKHETRSEDKEDIFEYWLSQFNQLMPKDILYCMQAEIDKSDSVLKKSDCCLYSLFMNVHEYEKIKGLVDKGNKIVNSPFTKNEITHVQKLKSGRIITAR